jgi:hypothetical protein
LILRCLVWLPDQKVALNNVLWPPNIYTPRGSFWRDPRVWRDATRVLRDLQPATAPTFDGPEKVGIHTDIGDAHFAVRGHDLCLQQSAGRSSVLRECQSPPLWISPATPTVAQSPP